MKKISNKITFRVQRQKSVKHICMYITSDILGRTKKYINFLKVPILYYYIYYRQNLILITYYILIHITLLLTLLYSYT